MTCLHRLLLEIARETYCVGKNPSGTYDYTAMQPYGLGLAVATHDVFELGIDLATLRSVKLPGPGAQPLAILAFRGTQPPRLTPDVEIMRSVTADWLQDAAMGQVPAAGGRPNAKVHSGFSHSLEALLQTTDSRGEKLEDRLEQLRDGDAELLITGHSKGGAIAHLAAWQMAVSYKWPTMRLRVVSFAAARSCNDSFANYYDEMFGDRATRYEIIEDVVPDLPAGPGQDFISRITSLFQVMPGASALEYYGVGKPIRGHFNESGLDGHGNGDLCPNAVRRRACQSPNA